MITRNPAGQKPLPAPLLTSGLIVMLFLQPSLKARVGIALVLPLTSWSHDAPSIALTQLDSSYTSALPTTNHLPVSSDGRSNHNRKRSGPVTLRSKVLWWFRQHERWSRVRISVEIVDYSSCFLLFKWLILTRFIPNVYWPEGQIRDDGRWCEMWRFRAAEVNEIFVSLC